MIILINLSLRIREGTATTIWPEPKSIISFDLFFLIRHSVPATSIGGALKWFASHIGTSRSSYGMNTNADVLLECDFTPLSKLTSPLEHGDISM